MVEKKYLWVTTLEEANRLAEEYSIKEVVVKYIGGVGNYYYPETHYLLSRRETGKYDDIERFKRVPISEEEQTVPEGWGVLHHTSKELILVKRGRESQREWAPSIPEVVVRRGDTSTCVTGYVDGEAVFIVECVDCRVIGAADGLKLVSLKDAGGGEIGVVAAKDVREVEAD